MGPHPGEPITRRPGTQARRIRLGPQQGTPQIFARMQASVERRLQEDMKKQVDQELQGSRGMEKMEEELAAVAATRRHSRLQLRVETCGPLRSTGSLLAWTTWAPWWFTRTAHCPGSVTGAR